MERQRESYFGQLTGGPVFPEYKAQKPSLGFFPNAAVLCWFLGCGQKHMLQVLKGFGTL